MTVDPKTLATYNANATKYAARFDTDAKPGTHVKRFIAAVIDGGRVLDLGCGTAGASRHMLAAGLEVDSMDASPEMIRVAAEVNGVTARLGTFDDLDAVAAYNGVWANFSLLHAAREDLPRYLGAIATSLRDGGIFHIGMKTGTGTRRDHLDRRYTFVEEAELQGLCEDAGIDVIETDRGHEVGLAGTNDWWVAMMGRKRG
jgi:SAM-dependent methyltransferase